MLETAAVITGFIILVWAGDRFVLGAASTARHLGVSPLIIGMVVVGFGTSAPEMLVGGIAAWEGSTGMAVGNALGSNITNIALVLGATALVAPLSVHSDLLQREFPILLLISLLALGLLADMELNFSDGIILMVGLGLFILWMVRLGMTSRNKDPLATEIEQEIPVGLSLTKALMWLVLGLALLSLGARITVWGGVGIAHSLGVSDLVIGLTVIAIGTSLPELVASIISARKNEHELAIGNVIGSNMFNLLAVLGIPALIHPAAIEPLALYRDFPVMLALIVAIFLMARGRHKEGGTIGRVKGSLLLAVYVAYMVTLYFTSGRIA